jgi:hypothetical protein
VTTDPFEMFPWVFSFVIGVLFGVALSVFAFMLFVNQSANLVCEVLK